MNKLISEMLAARRWYMSARNIGTLCHLWVCLATFEGVQLMWLFSHFPLLYNMFANMKLSLIAQLLWKYTELACYHANFGGREEVQCVPGRKEVAGEGNKEPQKRRGGAVGGCRNSVGLQRRDKDTSSVTTRLVHWSERGRANNEV